MERPKPKAELVVQRHDGTSLTLYSASADARTFIEQNAPVFGHLFALSDGRTFILYIEPTYDGEEVAHYFEAYTAR